MKHGSAQEALSQKIAQVDEVRRVGPRRSRGGFDFQRDDTGGYLGHDINFAATVLLSQMVQPWTRRTDFDLGTELSNDERIEDTAKEITIPQN